MAPLHPYRLGFAVKILDAGGLRTNDARRWRSGPHLRVYTVLNAPDEELRRKSALDLEQDAALLDALGQGPEGVVVLHVGGLYGDREAALGRRYERSARGRRRV